MSSEISNFFNEQAFDYHNKDHGMARFHAVLARYLEANLSGRVLSLGGLWNKGNLESIRTNVTQLILGDISAEMLKYWNAPWVNKVVLDGRFSAFQENAVDHVVFPLVLHHITENSAQQSRLNVLKILSQAQRTLCPGGTVWISEFSIPSWIYWIELLMSPLTKRLLGFAGIPLVIMHPHSFYRKVLQELGFQNIQCIRLQAPDARAWDWIQPIIGIPWLKIPRWSYPLQPYLISAQAS